MLLTEIPEGPGETIMDSPSCPGVVRVRSDRLYVASGRIVTIAGGLAS